MIMKKLHNAFEVTGGGYSSPELLVLNAVPEAGFAGSLDDWNSGRIPDDDSYYNTLEQEL